MTAPIDLEALRAALAKVVVHPLHHFGDVITDAYVSRKSDWELIAEALAELTTRRARDAVVEALVKAANRVLDKEWEYGDDQPHCVDLSAAIENLTGATP